MVKFDNIQQALDYSIGTIEGASEELTVRDYLKVVNSSTAIGRLFTQLKLLYNGKGWVNDKVATGMLQSQKLETLMSIQSLCDQILDPSKTPGNGSARGPESQRPLKVTSKDPLLGSQAKDRSEKSMEKKEIQGLHDLVCEVKNCRYNEIINLLYDTLNKITLKDIANDTELRLLFEESIDFALKNKNKPEIFGKSFEKVFNIINDERHAWVFPENGYPNYKGLLAKADDNTQWELVNYLVYYAADRIHKDLFFEDALVDLIGSPATDDAEATGLCRIKPENAEKLIALRDKLLADQRFTQRIPTNNQDL